MTAPLTADGRPLVTDYELALAHEHVFIDIRCWLDETHAPRAVRPRLGGGTTHDGTVSPTVFIPSG